jgi:hypothetical protein
MGDCKAEDIPRNMFLGVGLRYDIPASSGDTIPLETVLYGKVMVRHHGDVALRVIAETKDSGYEVVVIENNRMGEAIAHRGIKQSCGSIVLNIVEHFFRAFQSNAIKVFISILIYCLIYDIPARGRCIVPLETVLYGKAMVRHHGSVALRVTAVTKDSGYEVFAIVAMQDNRMGEAIAHCVFQQGCGFSVLNIVEHFFRDFQATPASC